MAEVHRKKFRKDFNDMTGMRFGKLVVLEFAGRIDRKSCWRCRCDCGREAVIRRSGLISKSRPIKSCGCYHARTPKNVSRHGMSHTSEYNIWSHIKQRCLCPRKPAYKRYGGRGITICERWASSFENFIHDMGPRPSLRHTIDRIDNGGNYEPGNCRWATFEQQNRNRSITVWLEAFGVRKRAVEWADQFGLSHSSVRDVAKFPDAERRLSRLISKKEAARQAVALPAGPTTQVSTHPHG